MKTYSTIAQTPQQPPAVESAAITDTFLIAIFSLIAVGAVIGFGHTASEIRQGKQPGFRDVARGTRKIGSNPRSIGTWKEALVNDFGVNGGMIRNAIMDDDHVSVTQVNDIDEQCWRMVQSVWDSLPEQYQTEERLSQLESIAEQGDVQSLYEIYDQVKGQEV